MDTNYGTAGIKIDRLIPSFDASASSPIFQIFAGTQDNQLGTESFKAEGGIFTNALVKALGEKDAGTTITMESLADEVSTNMLSMYAVRQSPKLVTIGGSGGIVWSR